jgi:hypothetical protein
MDPATVSLIMFGLQEAIKAEPIIASELQQLFSKGIPTEDDWAASRVRVMESYSQIVTNSALTPDAAPAAAPEPAPEPAPTPAAAPVPVAVFTGQAVDPHA